MELIQIRKSSERKFQARGEDHETTLQIYAVDHRGAVWMCAHPGANGGACWANFPRYSRRRVRPGFLGHVGAPVLWRRAAAIRSRPRLCGKSARYKCTLNFEGCGHAESKKTLKFVLNTALRPNQIEFLHSLGPLQIPGSPAPASAIRATSATNSNRGVVGGATVARTRRPLRRKAAIAADMVWCL